MKDMKEKREIQTTKNSSKPIESPIIEPQEIHPKEKSEPKMKNLTELGIACYETKQYQNAIDYFQQAITQDPENPILWTACGMALTHLEKLRESLPYFCYALVQDPHYETALLQRGLVWTKLEKFEEALKDFNAILIKDTHHEKALHYKANALLFSGQTVFSISSYLESLALNSKNPEVWYNLGCAMQKLRFHLNTILCYAQTLEINPEHRDALINTAHAYFSLGRYKKAIPFFLCALKLLPNDLETWTNLGITYEKLEFYSDALTCFNTALQIKSDYAPAKICQDRLAHVVLVPATNTQKIESEKENMKITLLFCNTADFLLKLQTGWEIYKKKELEISLNKHPSPPPRPAKPVFFLSSNPEVENSEPKGKLKPAIPVNGLTFLIDPQYTDAQSSAAAENPPIYNG